MLSWLQRTTEVYCVLLERDVSQREREKKNESIVFNAKTKEDENVFFLSFSLYELEKQGERRIEKKTRNTEKKRSEENRLRIDELTIRQSMSDRCEQVWCCSPTQMHRWQAMCVCVCVQVEHFLAAASYECG